MRDQQKSLNSEHEILPLLPGVTRGTLNPLPPAPTPPPPQLKPGQPPPAPSAPGPTVPQVDPAQRDEAHPNATTSPPGHP